jgi:hypothetical protein
VKLPEVADFLRRLKGARLSDAIGQTGLRAGSLFTLG